MGCGIFLSILGAVPLSARAADFIEVYTYRAGESDSKLTCRAVPLIEIKRLLLEKIGTYLETRTAVRNFQITSDEIVAMTAGIVKTEILREDWNGETYRLTARIEADPDDIVGEIDKMRKNSASTGDGFDVHQPAALPPPPALTPPFNRSRIFS